MKSNLCAMIIFAGISIAANAWAFNRNLTGHWTTPSGDSWVITHLGSQAKFNTVAYTEETGRLSFEFTGPVSGVEDGEDSFQYQGVGAVKNFRISGVRCRMTSRMGASGYMNGDIGGRVIHMNACSISMNVVCEGLDPIMNSMNCSGIWK